MPSMARYWKLLRIILPVNLNSIFRKAERYSYVDDEHTFGVDSAKCLELETQAKAKRAYYFEVVGGGGTYLTTAETVDKARQELEMRGWQVLKVRLCVSQET